MSARARAPAALDLAWYRQDGPDLILQILVQPRASRNGVVGVIGNHLKIRITSPAIAGRANEHLIAYLAELFGVPRRHVVLERGDISRRKRLRIHSPKKRPDKLDWGI